MRINDVGKCRGTYEGGRIRGSNPSPTAIGSSRWYNPPMRIPTARLRELRASSTEAEKAAWELLRDRRLGAKFRRQFRMENGVLDFYCFEHRLAIELDGGVHAQIDQMRKDAAKEDYLRTLGIRLLRIPNAMVLKHPDEFARTIVAAMKSIAENVGERAAEDFGSEPKTSALPRYIQLFLAHSQ